ncbi:MAG: hypothetical protein NWR72_03680 [Bacteroidia bacterium]|nr:hypothetical protein [Bacteroidia bacterium]
MKPVMARLYHFLQLLSLDVVLGALVSGHMVATLLGTTMPLSWWVALPVSVWVLYTTDHLLDAWRLGEQATSDRHRFHVVHFEALVLAWGLGLAMCLGVFSWWVPTPMLILGFAVGALSLLHLGLVWLVKDRVNPLLAKEAGVAFIYTAGVWIGPLSLVRGPVIYATGLAMLQFFALALINLITFASYEQEMDSVNGLSSWARALGPAASQWVIGLLSLLVMLLSYFILPERATNDRVVPVQATFLAMLALLVWVWVDRKRFQQNEAYRMVADAAFLLPVWFLWW